MAERFEHSAGGVVVNGDQVAVIVPRGRTTLQLPKGHIDPGETELEAAQREVREEAGLEVEAIKKLGDIEYSYGSKSVTINKKVSFYLFRYLSGDVADHDHEVDEAKWILTEQARKDLTFAGERDMIEKAANALQEMDTGSHNYAGT